LEVVGNIPDPVQLIPKKSIAVEMEDDSRCIAVPGGDLEYIGSGTVGVICVGTFGGCGVEPLIACRVAVAGSVWRCWTWMCLARRRDRTGDFLAGNRDGVRIRFRNWIWNREGFRDDAWLGPCDGVGLGRGFGRAWDQTVLADC